MKLKGYSFKINLLHWHQLVNLVFEDKLTYFNYSFCNVFNIFRTLWYEMVLHWLLFLYMNWKIFYWIGHGYDKMSYKISFPNSIPCRSFNILVVNIQWRFHCMVPWNLMFQFPDGYALSVTKVFQDERFVWNEGNNFPLEYPRLDAI